MKEILVTSSVLIPALLLLRFLFRKTISRRAQYALWGLVLLRLLFPAFIGSSAWSVASAAREARDTRAGELAADVVELAGLAHVPRMSWTRAYNETVAEEKAKGTDLSAMDPSTLDDMAYQRMSGRLTFKQLLYLVWYVGMGLMALLFLAVNLRFARKLRRTRVPLEGAESRYPAYLCDDIPSPCLFGLCKPSIYVTSAAAKDPETLRYVLAHEETHAKHLDPLWALLRSLCLVVWWFDPLVWLAAYLSKIDCELACDESVLSRLGEGERIPYGETLLRLVPLGRAGSPILNATTMTAGKRQMKDRIKRIAEHRKPLVVALVLVLVLAAVVCACTFTGAKEKPGDLTPSPAPTAAPSPVPTAPRPRLSSVPAGTPVYAGPEAYLEMLRGQKTSLTYPSAQGGEGEAKVLDTRVAYLEKQGELPKLAPEGTLELYTYLIEVKPDAEPEDISLVGGMTVTEDGWYDLEGQGGNALVLLRYADGSVSVLHDRACNDDMGGLYYYEETAEEMLWDWYVRTYGLDLPLYTLDLLPQNHAGNCPARRWDGDGWYIYIPIAGWEERSGENKWVSRYRTGSSIVVRETTEEYMTDAQREKTAPGQEERYVEGKDGRLWLVFTQFDPASITDAAEIRGEPQALEAMMESFTVRGGQERLRRTPEQTVPPTVGEQLRAAADRIFGTSQAPAGPSRLSVEADGRRDEYVCVPGRTWSLNQNMGYLLTSEYYKWHTLTEEEIADIDRDPAHGPVMEIWNETDRFTIYADSDALLWTELESGAEHWLCPEPRKDYSRPLYEYFLSTSRGAEMYRPEAQITVPGTVTDYDEVARLMAEQYVSILLDRPTWYVGVPQDAAVKGVSIFDAYYGEDHPNFCFGMGFYLKLSQDHADPDRSVFEAGAGLRDPVAEGPYAGWYEWGGEVTAALEDGVWRFLGMGTGGACAWLPYGVGYGFPADFDLSLEQLLDLYFLTGGNTREWRVMYALAHAPAEELREELMKLREEQRQLLYGSMEAYNAVYGAVEGNEDDWYGRFDLEAYR